jgi:S1-C subfamily serine protease
MAKYLMILCLLAGLSACAGNYGRSYQAGPANPAADFAPAVGEPRLMTGGDPAQARLDMYTQGYAVIGTSRLAGPAGDPADALAQAKKVGAAIVFVASADASAGSGSSSANTVHTEGAANGVGNYAGKTTMYSSETPGQSVAAGSAPTTSTLGTFSGKTTNYDMETAGAPSPAESHTQMALFFAPLQRQGFGVMVDDMTVEQARDAGTTQGVQILAVRNGSPAFSADIRPGDLLLSIEGRSTAEIASAEQAIRQATGHPADIVLVRGGQRITRSVTIPAGPW